MVIDNRILEDALITVKDKKDTWEQLTGLKFDNYGRALINNINITLRKPILKDFIDYFSGDNSLYKISESFIRCFNKYLCDNNLSIYLPNIRLGNNKIFRNLNADQVKNAIFFYKNFDEQVFRKVNELKNGEEIGIEQLLLNQIRVNGPHGIQEVKFSKVLSKVQGYWERENIKYTELVRKINILRSNRTYDKNIMDKLRKEKTILEKNNLYFDYQKISNMLEGSKGDLYLSINPMDELTASGSMYGEGIYPTSFKTCIVNKIYVTKDNLSVEGHSINSNPEQQFLLGKIKNKGILYVTNGKCVKHPKEDITLLGYKLRANIWLDKDCFYLSDYYPLLYNNKEFNIINNILKEITGLNISNEAEDHKFNIQDTDNIKKLYNSYRKGYNKRLYIENIAIRENELYFTDKNYYKSVLYNTFVNEF